MNRIFPIESAAGGLTNQQGKFFKVDAGVPAIVTATSDHPEGCLDYWLSDTKGGIALDGAQSVVLVSAAVTQFGFGKLNADGTVSAYTGAGGEVRVCQFLQNGVAGEYVNALIML